MSIAGSSSESDELPIARRTRSHTVDTDLKPARWYTRNCSTWDENLSLS